MAGLEKLVPVKKVGPLNWIDLFRFVFTSCLFQLNFKFHRFFSKYCPTFFSIFVFINSVRDIFDVIKVSVIAISHSLSLTVSFPLSLCLFKLPLSHTLQHTFDKICLASLQRYLDQRLKIFAALISCKPTDHEITDDRTAAHITLWTF